MKLSSTVFGGSRSVVHLVRGCRVMLTKNVAYRSELANGARGHFVGAVYAASARVGVFPEALVVEIADYRGPTFYKGRPKWVPILPSSRTKEGTRMTGSASGSPPFRTPKNRKLCHPAAADNTELEFSSLHPSDHPPREPTPHATV